MTRRGRLIPATATSAVTSAAAVVDVNQPVVSNNALVFDYTGATPSAFLRERISGGHAAGHWNGSGTLTSCANAHTDLGCSDAADRSISNFVGKSVDCTLLLPQFTQLGDTDLNRDVNMTDFSLLAANLNRAETRNNGDLDYSGSVGISNFSVLASNFILAWSAVARSAVLEPLALAWLGAARLFVARVRVAIRSRTQL